MNLQKFIFSLNKKDFIYFDIFLLLIDILHAHYFHLLYFYLMYRSDRLNIDIHDIESNKIIKH